MRKIIYYIKVYWLKIFVLLLIVGATIGSIYFVNYCFKNFFGIEAFMRRSMSAQMALMIPMFLLVNLISMPLMLWLQYYFLMGGGLGGGKHDLAKVKVKWDEVIGMEAAKREAMELVKLLKDRKLVRAIGGKIIKGIIFFGPPGCGKTYLAKAIATECKLPLLTAVGSDFIGIFMGQGTSRMKSLFNQARALAKIEGGCLIFIDEIDSFARPRMADQGFGGRLDVNATINQFLTEIDGLRKTENNIIILGATNASECDLDSAIMRAGRLERKIYVSLPNLKERKALFDFYLSKVKCDTNISADLLARKALWFSPADIEGVIREASLIAARDSRQEITMKDMSEAYDRVVFGMKSNIVLNDKEKLWTAYHEAGHAIIGYLLHPTDDIIKATIIPRKGYLGMVARRPIEELYAPDKEELLADIKVMIAAYVAEKTKFGITTHGVGGSPGSDFYNAIRTARTMVYSLGMGKSGYVGDFTATRDYYGSMQISEKTKEALDNDVQEILQSCIKEVEEILVRHKDLLDEFSQELYKREELEYDDIERIFKKYGLKRAMRANQNETV